jgi:hypothetical protein
LAKTKNPQAPKPPPGRTGFDGRTRDELRRDLGLDEFTYEACFRELFAELYDLGPAADASTADAPSRVTQMGPGRRRRPGKSE